MSKYEYKFEVEESINDNIGAVKVDSLESALKRILPDGIIYATCHYPTEKGRPMCEVIELRGEDVNQQSEGNIYEFLDNEVDKKRFHKIINNEEK